MICPYCGAGGLLRGSTPGRHFWRVLTLSGKRYCPSCRRKWQRPPRYLYLHALLFNNVTVLLVSSVGTALIVVLLLSTMFNPVRWFKTRVKTHYDDKYGDNSKKKLWQDLGSLYGLQGKAKDDYVSHDKN